MAKPASAHMVSTSTLTTTNTSPVIAARLGVIVSNDRIHRGDSVWPCAGQPAVDAERDQRQAQDYAHPGRPGRWLVVQRAKRVGGRDEDRGQRDQSQQPAAEESEAGRPRPRRLQHQHRRDDRERRDRDDECQRNQYGQHGTQLPVTGCIFASTGEQRVTV